MLEYIHRLVVYLLNKEAFRPVEDLGEWQVSGGDNTGTQSGSVRLVRQQGGSWQFIRILEADRFSEDDISQGIKQDVESFENFQHATRSSRVTGSTILVFQQGLSVEKARKLVGFQHRSLWQNIHNLIWVVDLQRGVVFHEGAGGGAGFLSKELLIKLKSQDLQESIAWEEAHSGSDSENAPVFEKAPTPVITYTLIGINVLLWVLMTLAGGSGNSEVLMAFGAKVNALIVAGEYWRLLTPVFLHIGIDHLLFNCFALYQLGIGAEQLFGRVKYLAIYLCAGIFGNLGSFVFSDYLSAGASGAIFGIMGAYLYFGTRERKIFSSGMGGSIVAILVINLVYGLINSRVDNFAHLGGLIGGFLISCSVGLGWEKALRGLRVAWLMGSVLLLLVLFRVGLSVNS
ncbi:MAG TPA: rhomboid family intramembrane serine protease [Bacillota bacterium]|nr:rhomboid family intramembrane serine protease [Bacillota bacterium]